MKCPAFAIKIFAPVSLPARGAWIEIYGNSTTSWNGDVAPRKGSVD